MKANLSDGVATLENARLDTSDGTLTLAGIVPFVDRSLALSGEVVFPSSQPQQPQESGTDGQASQPPAETRLPSHRSISSSAARGTGHLFLRLQWERGSNQSGLPVRTPRPS